MKALLFLIAATSQPANVPTLRDFLDAGDKMNVDRRISVEQVARAAAEFKQAWLALLPSVTVNGSYTYNQYEAAPALPNGQIDFTTSPPTALTTKIVIQPHNQWQGAARFELPLLNASLWARVAASSAAEDAVQSRDRLSADIMRRNVVIAYYGYVASLSVKESSQKTLGVSQELLKLAEIRRSVGTAVELDVLRARAEVERSNQAIADATAAVATSARSLRTLTGVEPPALIVLGPDDLRPEPGFGELEATVDQLPLVVSAEWDFKTARRLKTSSYLALVPIIGAQFTEQLSNATGFTGQNTSYNAGLFLVWRLDGVTFATMAQQGALAATAELGLEKARLSSRDQIHSDWQRFTASRTKVTAAAAQVEAADRAQQIASSRYNLGAATQLDTIQAARDAFFAEVAQIQARTDLAIARASLRISSGRPLD